MRPPLQATFQTYHLMIALGSLMLLIVVLASIQWRRNKLWESTKLLKVLVPSVLLPMIATQAGWFAAEVGRQPWIVYEMLRTDEALSKAVKANQIVASLVLFLIVYGLLLALFLYLLDRKIKQGPDDDTPNSDDMNLGLLPPATTKDKVTA